MSYYEKNITIKSFLTLLLIVVIIGGLYILNLINKPPEVLKSERRTPSSLPNLTLQNILSAKYMDEFENFAADNFVFRDKFRTVKAAAVFYLFQQTDKSGLYYDDLVGLGKFEQLNEKSLREVAAKIKKISTGLKGMNIYYSFIPDKDIYAEKNYPGFDVNMALTILSNELQEMTLIDLTDTLSAKDFYKTDFHWNQVKLENVVFKMGEIMGFNIDISSFTPVKAGEFQGVYSGQLALPFYNDEMIYLVPNDPVSIYYLDEKSLKFQQGDIYDIKAFNGQDPYDIFLRGVQPLIVLENPNSATSRELYLFRDSFSSSLAPLLTSAYRKITLIDLRYIDFSYLLDYISFKEGSDIMFLYSSLILNNPWDLRIR